jgi:DNA (cytosine-5)-methyltransferase 1
MMPKKPYRIPDTAWIMSRPWNGLKVVSTFSGCGGSCLGYRWAGYKVVWANEFLPAAQESYKANFKDTYLDCRNIRNVTAMSILLRTGLKQGELGLFDGSPPCQAFSMAGKREKGWGKEKTYEHGVKQCNEKMFDEYIRLLDGLQPRVFIAENVKGLTMGAAAKMMGSFQDDMFDSQDDTILRKLMACGYLVRHRILNAAHYGVPQNRVRIIFQGVRRDLNCDPVWPKALPHIYSVRDALPHIYSVECKLDNTNPDIDKSMCSILKEGGKSQILKVRQLPKSRIERMESGHDLAPADLQNQDGPSPTITCGSPGNDVSIGTRKLTIEELKRLGGFPDDFILTGSYAQQWARIGNSVAPPFMRAIAAEIAEKILLAKGNTFC